jgi:Fic family protein
LPKRNIQVPVDEPNIYALDSAYKPFPTFEEWLSKTGVDTVRWDRYNALIKSAPQRPTQEVLNRALEIAKRAAAIDTGAIEGLYEVDRGFTYTVAFETTAWELALAHKGENVKSLFEAQLSAYDYALSLATKAEPISEAAIRVLHEEVCKAQATYRVETAVGPQEQPLPKGQYKIHPNHVRTRKGEDHSYAPVDVTPAEMARLVRGLRSVPFLAAHPVLQAAYAHYALVVIHPFADGNGRVARALASAFTYRSISMPIVILSEHKENYLSALESADAGDYQRFVNFMLLRSLDTIQLVYESVRGAGSPNPLDIARDLQKLYVTKGGYTQDEVDQSGQEFEKLITNEIGKRVKEFETPKLHGSLSYSGATYIPQQPPTHRLPLSGGQTLNVSLASDRPAAARVFRSFALLVPRDAGAEDDIQLRELPQDELAMLKEFPQGEVFTARMDELRPVVSGTLSIRVSIFVERLLSEMLGKLNALAEQEARNNR